ncbi:hypothetical protein LWM68_01340 [Niabella sp. W65]|nr:hypothetical protein [Niabella sp. W65]MCH7361546.1 hypothetical protein [Niabella sp. W65]
MHKKRVRGVELQTTEAIDGILEKIAAFNQQGSSTFIERTPSFFSSRAGLYTLMVLAAILGLLVILSPAKTEKNNTFPVFFGNYDCCYAVTKME